MSSILEDLYNGKPGAMDNYLKEIENNTNLIRNDVLKQLNISKELIEILEIEG